MAERRTLTDGLKATPTIDPVVAREFIHAGKVPPESHPHQRTVVEHGSVVANRAPISTRIRSDFATALKRASLERQLQGVEPYTLQDMLEQAIEPWLRSNGYLT